MDGNKWGLYGNGSLLLDEKMSRFIKNPDEIVLEDVKMVHYETMEEGRAVWLGIYLNNGKMYHLNIGGDNLYVNYSDETPE